MAITRSQRIAQRLGEIDKEYRGKHKAAHTRFKTVYATLLSKYGFDVSTLPMDHFGMPAAFYEELEEHKQALVAALTEAHHEKHSSASTIKPNVSYIRAN